MTFPQQANPDAGLPPRSVSNVPVPDPSSITTENIEREVSHLRELIEAQIRQVSLHLDAADAQADARVTLQIADIRRTMEAKFEEQLRAVEAARNATNKAVDAALDAAKTAVAVLEDSITQRVSSLSKLTDSKFITYGESLAAQTSAVKAAIDSAERAVTKAEVFNEKRFETLTTAVADINHREQNFVTRNEYEQLRTSITEKIDDLKGFAAATTGRATGANSLWAIVVSVIIVAGIIINIALRYS